MNQYMLSVHSVAGAPRPDAATMQKMYADVAALNQKLKEDGAWVFACGLHLPSSATVVAMKEGDVLLTDGPFSEAKEHIGGFWIIKAPDLDAAIGWATKATVACGAPVEVRPVQEPA
ncbi:MAG TPA: YciI family protein [Polyangiaceae bacterium]|nr:YciI family protein [Polyangiaceae bacterium]